MSNPSNSVSRNNGLDRSGTTSGIGRDRRIIRTLTRATSNIRAGKRRRVIGTCKSLRRTYGARMTGSRRTSIDGRQTPIDSDVHQPGPSVVQEESSAAATSISEIESQQPNGVIKCLFPKKLSNRIAIIVINEDIEKSVVFRPQSKQAFYALPLQDKGPQTLACLQRGLTVYVKIIQEVEYLESYRCVTPRCANPRFSLYKRLKLVDPPPEYIQSLGSQDSFELIRLYVRCFAAIADFNFEYNLSSPLTGEGLPNVLVVNKVWEIDSSRRMVKPKYQLFDGDFYTQHVLRRLRDFFNFKSVKFISTVRNTLFASSSMVTNPDQPANTASSCEIPSSSVVDTPGVLVNNHEHPSSVRKKSVSFAGQQPPPSTSVDLNYYTLILFIPNVASNSTELTCVISIEVHLGATVVKK